MKRIQTLRELQEISVYIYRDAVSFCREHGLRLYPLGGTLIGAVRHKGFIPWDDDIDVCMSRPDYERMLALSEGKISGKCRLIDPASTPDYKGYIPVIVYENSRLLSGQYREAEELKIGISVFIYDGVPKNALARRLYYARMYMLRAEHALCRADFKNVNTRPAKLFGSVLSPLYKAGDVYKYKEKILRWQKKYPYAKSALVSTNADADAWKEVFPRESFEKAVKLEFEGMKIDAFSHYHDHLTRYYGDYMTPPDAAAQAPKHSFDAWIEDSFIFPKA